MVGHARIENVNNMELYSSVFWQCRNGILVNTILVEVANGFMLRLG